MRLIKILLSILILGCGILLAEDCPCTPSDCGAMVNDANCNCYCPNIGAPCVYSSGYDDQGYFEIMGTLASDCVTCNAKGGGGDPCEGSTDPCCGLGPCCGDFCCENPNHPSCDVPTCENGGIPNCCGGVELAAGKECCNNVQVDTGKCCGGVELADGEICCNKKPIKETETLKCCNDKNTYDPITRTPSNFSGGFTADDFIKSKINDALGHIPNANIKVTDVSFQLNTFKQDCCAEDAKPGGIEGGQGTASFGLNAKNIKVWPAGPVTTQEATIDIVGATFKIYVDAGVFFSVNSAISADVGLNVNDCDKKNCQSAGVDWKTSAALDAKFEGLLCFKYPKESEKCEEWDITPISAELGFGVTGSYNKDSGCSSGWKGKAYVGSFGVKSTIRVTGVSLTYTWYSYDGWSG